jgi:effector-binding domain-containing protein
MNLIILLLLIILSGLTYFLLLPGKYDVRRSITIQKDLESVFEFISDFKNWGQWSPWLMHERDAQVDISENSAQVGASYHWNGKKVGEGTMTHIILSQPGYIEDKLEFVRPFKALNTVIFELIEIEKDHTHLTWTMQGSLPFLFRPFMSRTVDMITKDFDLGLAMLNGAVDLSASHPVITFNGCVDLQPQQVEIISFTGSMDDLKQAMQAGYPQLMRSAAEQNKEITGVPLAIYKKMDKKNKAISCDMALPVQDGKTTVGGGKYLEVIHQGDYKFLELTWYSAFANLKMNGFKYDWHRSPMEFYLNDPMEIADTNQLLTKIVIPIK